MTIESMRAELPPLPSPPVDQVEQVQPAPEAAPLRRPEAEPAPARQRLLSLDVYRGLIMVTLAFNGFGLAATAVNHLRAEGPSDFWETVRYHFDHVQWTGCGYWDLIQPSFMFMVGVAMAFSYSRRAREGQSFGRMLGHAAFRSLVLIFLGIFLISNFSRSTEWSLMNVLTQIGLGYAFLFLLRGLPPLAQAGAAAGILVATWALYVGYALWLSAAGLPVGIDLETGAPEVGVSQAWAQENLAGVPAAWHKNANVGHAIDVWLLNHWPPRVWPVTLLPAPRPFVYNSGGYQTINFLPSLATMLFGLMCGELLRTPRSARQKLLILAGAGLAGLTVGLLLDASGVCPIVKRIWTPAWALFSTGICCLILAALYAVVDVLGYRRWAFPLVVVGVNSIAIYCMSQLLKPWAVHTWKVHLGDQVFLGLGELYEPAVQAVLVGLLFWLACLWMYRQKIFVRI